MTNVQVDCATNTGRSLYFTNFDTDTVTTLSREPNTGTFLNQGQASTETLGPIAIAADPIGRFVYAATQGGGLEAFLVDPASGGLTQFGFSIAASDPFSMVVEPLGQFGYVTSADLNALVYFVIFPNGFPVVSGSLPTGLTPVGVAADPTGRFVYVANVGTSTISTFAINRSSGPTVVGGEVLVGAEPVALAVHPNGRFLYAANFGDDSVSTLRIDPATGIPSNVGVVSYPGDQPEFLAVGPNGRYLYVGTRVRTDVFRLDQMTGMPSGPVDTILTTATTDLEVDPLGSTLYEVSQALSTVTEFAVDPSTGDATEVGDSFAGFDSLLMATSPPRRFAYVATGDDRIATVVLDPRTGMPQELGSSVAATEDIAVVASDPAGRFVYANLGLGELSSYVVDPRTGELSPTGSSAAVRGLNVAGIAADPTGRFVYSVERIETGDGNVSAFRVNPSTGELEGIGGDAVSAGQSPVAIVLGPRGLYVYVVNDGGSAFAFRVDQETGELASAGASVFVGASPSSIEVDPTGRFAFVCSGAEDTLTVAAIDEQDGGLTVIDSVSTLPGGGEGPNAIAMDLSGRFVYTANGQSGNVSMFRIDQSTGSLTSLGDALSAGEVPFRMATGPNGGYLYVADALTKVVTALQINAATGVLEQAGTSGEFENFLVNLTVLEGSR